MTDVRPTDRLLEVIEDRIRVVASEEEIYGFGSDEVIAAIAAIATAITELRRRGDTLVRADDLRLAVDVFTSNGTFSLCSGWEHPDKPMLLAARDRLKNALGGACHIEKPA